MTNEPLANLPDAADDALVAKLYEEACTALHHESGVYLDPKGIIALVRRIKDRDAQRAEAPAKGPGSTYMLPASVYGVDLHTLCPFRNERIILHSEIRAPFDLPAEQP